MVGSYVKLGVYLGHFLKCGCWGGCVIELLLLFIFYFY
jgi:hypothetical protein